MGSELNSLRLLLRERDIALEELETKQKRLENEITERAIEARNAQVELAEVKAELKSVASKYDTLRTSGLRQNNEFLSIRTERDTLQSKVNRLEATAAEILEFRAASTQRLQQAEDIRTEAEHKQQKAAKQQRGDAILLSSRKEEIDKLRKRLAKDSLVSQDRLTDLEKTNKKLNADLSEKLRENDDLIALVADTEQRFETAADVAEKQYQASMERKVAAYEHQVAELVRQIDQLKARQTEQPTQQFVRAQDARMAEVRARFAKLNETDLDGGLLSPQHSVTAHHRNPAHNNPHHSAG